MSQLLFLKIVIAISLAGAIIGFFRSVWSGDFLEIFGSTIVYAITVPAMIAIICIFIGMIEVLLS